MTAAIYTFGGPRVNGRPQTINFNDRRYKCSMGRCEIDRTFPINYPIPQSDLFNIDLQLFDIEQLRQNLNTVSNEVTVAYRDILKWFHDLEQTFALRIQMGEIAMNITLFNKLNLIIPKFITARKIMDTWYNDFIRLATELADALGDYDQTVARIRTLSSNNTLVAGGAISENVITLAKQNLSRSRALQRLITRLVTQDSKIRLQLQTLTFKVNELTTGILRYGDKKILNLMEIANAISNLGEANSPLTRIQAQLSTVINTTPLNFILKTQPPDLIPSVRASPNDMYQTFALTPDKLIEKLHAIKEITMYTTSTKPIIDSLDQYINLHFRENVEYETMMELINRIRQENIPMIFLDNLQTHAANPENIYLTIDVITRTISQLSEPDLIYMQRLSSILNMANETARILQQQDIPMDVDPPNDNDNNNNDGGAAAAAVEIENANDGLININNQNLEQQLPPQPQPRPRPRQRPRQRSQVRQQQQQQQQQEPNQENRMVLRARPVRPPQRP